MLDNWWARFETSNWGVISNMSLPHGVFAQPYYAPSGDRYAILATASSENDTYSYAITTIELKTGTTVSTRQSNSPLFCDPTSKRWALSKPNRRTVAIAFPAYALYDRSGTGNVTINALSVPDLATMS